MTRKRKRSKHSSESSRKQPRLTATDNKTRSTVLTSCYPNVLTLREYFLTRLPSASRVRRERLQALNNPVHDSLLDTYLVGVSSSDPSTETEQERVQELVNFTQTLGSTRTCYTGYTGQGQSSSLEELVDFVVWLLFKSCPVTSARPRHILCNGLRKGTAGQYEHDAPLSGLAIPGVYQQHPNESLEILKRSPWDEYLALLGVDGERILTTLLLDCGLFVRLDQGCDNYLQVSGTPICDLSSRVSAGASAPSDLHRPPSAISFIRNRILYARPSLTKQGHVQFGLKHIHVLQRYPLLDRPEQTTHILKHVFPRQFKLQNVFTSQSDARKTSQNLPDYAYREEELAGQTKHPRTWVPRRLRGADMVVQKMRKRHARCSYTQLLRHYCPTTPDEAFKTIVNGQSGKLDPSSPSMVTQRHLSANPLISEHVGQSTPQNEYSFLSYATPASQVSAFCRASLMQILPRMSLGRGLEGRRNWNALLFNIDRFVCMRRFETLNLHEVCCGFGTLCIEWLRPPKMNPQDKLSASDLGKRLEIFREFIYYVFDSLLIPFIRSNFYVTESGVHRNRLFFFRHDVWRKMSEPSLATLRLRMYQPMKPSEVRQILDSKSLGYSHVRLLPKGEGTRPITNLRKRVSKLQGGRRVLGPSINAQLGPVFSTLGYERRKEPSRLGGAIFSTAGLHDKLKCFQRMITPCSKMYFVKVDIQSCFDAIPQMRLIEMMESIIAQPQYRTTRYIELKSSTSTTRPSVGRCRQNFAGRAHAANEGPVLSKAAAADIVRGKEGIVLMDNGNQKLWQRGQLMQLLREHVQKNMVKIGKKHFSQTIGIPQGSVLSSTLCSFFYSEFEEKYLDFLSPTSSMLVRLIDDFLLVTIDKGQALQFVQVMIKGEQEFGISVNPDKTLINFEAQVGGRKIPRHHSRNEFPFCGVVVDTHSLEVRKDWQRKDKFMNNGLTVDSGPRAGNGFRRKVLLSFKMQMQAILLDATLNSRHRIVATCLEAFEETAMKMHQYAKNLPQRSRPSAKLVCEVIMKLVRVASSLGQRKQAQVPLDQAHESVSRPQMMELAAMAFERVLLPKQTEYQEVLRWLRLLRLGSGMGHRIQQPALRQLVENQSRVVDGCVY